MGFAVVDVNMRGTGCSGGAFDFFEPLQNLDGYDVIETIAHQSWVLGPQGRDDGHLLRRDQPAVHRPARPPDLEAISPLSTIDATATTLYPGGILNTGFAVAWAKQRQHEAEPAGPDERPALRRTSRSRAATRPARPTRALHGEAANLIAKIHANAHYKPGDRRPAGPGHLRAQDQGAGVHGLPVGRRADRRTLPRPGRSTSPARSRSGSRSPTAPTSIRSIPYTYNRWYDFLELFVAHQAPVENAAVIAPRRRSSTSRRWACRRPTPSRCRPTRSKTIPTYSGGAHRVQAAARSVGVSSTTAPALAPGGTRGRRRPVRRVRARTSRRCRSRAPPPAPGTSVPDGTLNASRPADSEQQLVHVERQGAPAHRLRRATPAAAASGATRRSGAGTGSRIRQGTAVRYVSAPLTSNTTVIGSGAVHLWVKSSTPDVDLQATVSEVRPDGNETFVQNG